MKAQHFSEEEFVALAEDAMDPRRAAHAEDCRACREQVEHLRAVLRQTAAADVPEPSPLFWEHFQGRVRDGVADERIGGLTGWGWTGVRVLAPYAAVAALVLAVFSGVLLVRAARHPPTPAGAAIIAPTASDTVTAAVVGAGDEEVWDVLTAAASTVELDEARDAGMRAHPAAIDHAVQGLTAAELTELGRLLQTELKRSSN